MLCCSALTILAYGCTNWCACISVAEWHATLQDRWERRYISNLRLTNEKLLTAFVVETFDSELARGFRSSSVLGFRTRLCFCVEWKKKNGRQRIESIQKRNHEAPGYVVIYQNVWMRVANDFVLLNEYQTIHNSLKIKRNLFSLLNQS